MFFLFKVRLEGREKLGWGFVGLSGKFFGIKQHLFSLDLFFVLYMAKKEANLFQLAYGG